MAPAPRLARRRDATCSWWATPARPSTRWNGADPTLLDRLPELLPGTTVLRLDDNHRSTPQVVAAATAVLGAEPGQASRPDGPCPVVEGFDDDDAEAAAVARWLRRAHRPGRPWSQLAVLARTNARLEPVARALARAGIPHRVAGDAKAAAARSRTPWPSSAGRRGPSLAQRLGRAGHGAPGRTAPVEAPPGDGEPLPTGGGRCGLTPALARLADEHAVECPDATVGEFLSGWPPAARVRWRRRPVDGVELSTFHRAKGLEWPAVAVVGLEDGMVPIAYAMTPDAVAEERRLLYVGADPGRGRAVVLVGRTAPGRATARGAASPRPCWPRRRGQPRARCRPSPTPATSPGASPPLRARLPDAG